ncbi:MAG: monovalent cation/H+ antiporter complex subunit F [Kiritimatiellia bacterium]
MSSGSFFSWAALGILCTLLLAFIRVCRGPSAEDRLLGIQSFGTVGTAVVILLYLVEGSSGYLDVALVMAMLAAVTVITFTRILPGAGDVDPGEAPAPQSEPPAS